MSKQRVKILSELILIFKLSFVICLGSVPFFFTFSKSFFVRFLTKRLLMIIIVQAIFLVNIKSHESVIQNWLLHPKFWYPVTHQVSDVSKVKKNILG